MSFSVKSKRQTRKKKSRKKLACKLGPEEEKRKGELRLQWKNLKTGKEAKAT